MREMQSTVRTGHFREFLRKFYGGLAFIYKKRVRSSHHPVNCGPIIAIFLPVDIKKCTVFILPTPVRPSVRPSVRRTHRSKATIKFELQ